MSANVAVFLIWGGLLLGAEASADDAEADGEALVLVGEPSQSAALIGVAGKLAEFRVGSRRRTVDAGQLVRWGRARSWTLGAIVLLRDGGRLSAQSTTAPIELRPGAVRVHSTLYRSVDVPRNAVQALLLSPPGEALPRDRLIERLRQPSDVDRLWLTNGDEISGTLLPVLGEEARTLVMQVDGERAKTPMESVAAVRYRDPIVAAEIEPEKDAWWLGLRDGSLLRVTSVTTSDDAAIQLAGGPRLEAGPFAELGAQIVSLRPVDPAVRYLSDGQALQYRHWPLLTAKLPFGLDQNCRGGRLRHAGRVVEKGVGMPSKSRLLFVVPPKFPRFRASLAIDALAGPGGSVRGRVFLVSPEEAPRELWTSEIIRGNDAPVELDLHCQPGRAILLVIESADRGDQLDYANWLDARFEPAPSQ